jgi:DNA-binding protein Fis
VVDSVVDNAVVQPQALDAQAQVSATPPQNSSLNDSLEYTIDTDTHSHANWDQMFSSSIQSLLNEMSEQAKNTISIGTAIEAKLLQMGHAQAGSHSQTALLLAIPVSTARRRLQKQQPDMSLLITLNAWQDISNLLALLVDRRTNISNPLETVKTIIAAQILKQYGANMTLASQLMGVSEPTMYKLRKAVI